MIIAGDITATVVASVRSWPWILAFGAALAVNVLIGLTRDLDFRGINGFSTTNFGWLAFTLVGGVVLAWRLARRQHGWLPWRLLASPVMSFIVCFIAVTLMGIAFLPGQPVAETMTTDALGRSFWVALLVAVMGVVCETLWFVVRRIGRMESRDQQGETT